MKKETAGAILALLFIVMAGFRIAIAFSEPTMTFDGYAPLRYVDHIVEHGLPLYEDELSYGGRTHVYSPIYYYILAPFAFLFPTVILLKFLPNLLFATVVLFVYFISYDITKQRGPSLVAATIAAFTPIIFSQSINDASSTTLTIPLIMFAVYSALNLKKRLPQFIFSMVLLALISPLVYLLLLGIVIYLLIMGAERLKVDAEYAEILIFMIFFSIWASLLFFRDAFLQSGIASLWTYLPSSLLETYFSEFMILSAVTTIGVIPILFGGYASYRSLFRERIKKVLFVSSFAAAAIILLSLKLIPLRTGMVILAIMLCALAGQGLRYFFGYFERTRVPWMRHVAVTLLILFLVFASAFPALSEAASQASETPSQEELDANLWLRDNAPDDAMILATPKEGFMIEYVANKKTFFDRDFLLIQDVDALYEDAEHIYRSRFALPALTRLNKHGITHIIVDDNVRRLYARDDLLYADHECFRPVYTTETIIIYEVTCDIRTQ